MNKKLRIGIVIVVAIVAVAIFSGCIEEEKAPEVTPTPSPTPSPTPTPVVVAPSPTPSPTPSPSPIANLSPSQSLTAEPSPSSIHKPAERAEISIISDAKPVDYEDYPALNVSIFGTKFHGDLNVTVKNEDGDILDTVIISPEKEHGWIRTNLKIGGYHETLKEKELSDVGYEASRLGYKFTIIVSDVQGKLADNTFRFEGVKIVKEDAYFDNVIGVEDKYLTTFVSGIHYKLRNEGALLAYPHYVQYPFGERSWVKRREGATYNYLGTPLLPRETREYYRPVTVAGSEYYSLSIFDKKGRVLAP